MRQLFYRWILNLFFPRLCVGCHQVGSYLCSNCTQQISQKDLICPQCTRPAMFGQTHPICQRPYGLDGLWTYGSYSLPLKQLLQKLKYRGIYDLVEELVDLVITYWLVYPPQFLDLIKKDRGVNWIIVPVPLHPQRQRQRGFNQSTLIAKSLAKKTGLEYRDCLIKTKNTQPQAKLDRHSRLINLHGAFKLAADCQLLAASILLVDDVWTTGTTLRECAKILKRSGAKQVWGLTIAR